MLRKVASEHKTDLTIQQRVAQNIKDLMHRMKVTPTALANEVGIAKTTITRCLSGETAPSLETLNEIANALHTSPDKLLLRSARDVSLTGIRSIDDAVIDMKNALWSDIETAQRLIGHRIHPDYRLWYCDAPTVEEAKGPTFTEEISLNLSHPHDVKIVIYSAAILSDYMIMMHTCSLSNYTMRSTDLPRKVQHDKIARTELIDTWELTHSIDEIKSNKELKWQITARKLKILRESQEV